MRVKRQTKQEERETVKLNPGDHMCTSCGYVFSSIYAFDAHRTGKTAIVKWKKRKGMTYREYKRNPERRCMTKREMKENGFRLNSRGRLTNSGEAPENLVKKWRAG